MGLRYYKGIAAKLMLTGTENTAIPQSGFNLCGNQEQAGAVLRGPGGGPQ